MKTDLTILRSHRAAWSVAGLTVAVNAAGLVLAILDRSVQSVTVTVMFAITTTGFAAIGALIASRQVRNPMGWLFIVVAFTLAFLHSLAQNYAVYALVAKPHLLPGGRVAFWFASDSLDSVFVLAMTLLVLLFPNGSPLTSRWRLAVWCAILGAVASSAVGLTAFTFSPPLEHFQNPLAVTGEAARLVGWARAAGSALSLVAFIAGVGSMVLRFRRSAGIEREQVKWVAVGVVIEAAIIVVSALLSAAGVGDFSGLAFVFAIGGFPALMGIAILRYRLYDIEIVIRRTLVYACLAAVIAVVYLGGIAILGAVFRSATGQSGPLAVTLSTLAVAAVFQPLRRRIRHSIDRRFSRRTYAAETAVEAFTGRLRQQIDLDALCLELIGVVDDTMQPRHATLWLRHADGDPRQGVKVRAV